MSQISSIPFSALPTVRLLGNGHYTVLLHANGGGFSRFGPWQINDWNGDRVQERGAWVIHVRDQDSGEDMPFMSTPTLEISANLHGDATLARLTEVRGSIEMCMEVSVSHGHDCEIRRLVFRDLAAQTRRLTVTAFLPLALHHPAAHAAHPAFSRLFVQTAFDPATQSLLAHRRPRAAGEATPYVVARLLGPGALAWDTDRAAFLGRGSGEATPHGLDEGLGGAQQSVLDPAFVLQREIQLEANGCAELVLLVGAADRREDALALAALPLEALTLKTPSGGETSANASDELALQSLAGAMFYGWPALAADPALRQQVKGHPGVVWGFGMPSDRPFMLVITDATAEILWATKARRYWAGLGLDIPVLVLHTLVEPPAVADGVVMRSLVDATGETLDGVMAVAALLCGNRVPAYAKTQASSAPVVARLQGAAKVKAPNSSRPQGASGGELPAENLQFDNGFGGFNTDGSEYVIRLAAEYGRLKLPPLPWTNVLANPRFGCLVSETGAGCTWSVNSREYRLTPWSNDPQIDPHDDALYLRDDANGHYWSPLPGPAWSGAACETRHGFGYTRFFQCSHGIEQATTVFVHRELPVRVTTVQLKNATEHSRKLRLFSFQRLVLGFLPTQTAGYVKVEVDPAQSLLRACNNMAGEFAGRIAFARCIAHVDLEWQGSHCRQGFLGAGGDMRYPYQVATLQPALPAPAAADPCFLQEMAFTLSPGETLTISLLLGDAADEAELQAILQQLDSARALESALHDVRDQWRNILTAVQVETPSPALDVMMNGWLLYQTLACRVWGRTAFYQASGAFGFRDQLQDAGALVYARPDLTRAQILLHASRQFLEGDVQHWWHEPPIDRGLRTRFADDLNWLPMLTAFYIRTTGDAAILDEQVAFLSGAQLAPGEDEAYTRAERLTVTADLYEHCVRALDRSLTRGEHGLPLMGTGDWNDGMNRVGREGRGESVWMGFFLHFILGEFLPLCRQRNDVAHVARYGEYRQQLALALESEGWDGQWYRRAWYDNGNPVGSSASDECRIDALVQAWSVISGVASPDHARQALDSLDQHLVDRDGKLIRLLTPPFVDTPDDPGYIKGYVAGVRENGGQYTHAATWVVRAMAEAGRYEQAVELLEMLLPVTHSDSAEGAAIYKTEPYVVVADIYSVAPHVGRGGWTWYTGAAGWLYRVALESVLGFTMEEGNRVTLKPRVPAGWPGFTIRYRLPAGGLLTLKWHNQAGGRSASMDGQAITEALWLHDGVQADIPAPEKDHCIEIHASWTNAI